MQVYVGRIQPPKSGGALPSVFRQARDGAEGAAIVNKVAGLQSRLHMNPHLGTAELETTIETRADRFPRLRASCFARHDDAGIMPFLRKT